MTHTDRLAVAAIPQEDATQPCADTLPEIAFRLLAQRGIEIENAAAVSDFLYPSLLQLPAPHRFKNMNRATAILVEALEKKCPVSIYGDYDVDGATAVALLAIFFQHLGLKVFWFVPSRLDDGYGVSDSGLQTLRGRGSNENGEAGVLVTVDCGIKDHAGIARAKELGFTVIVTDHHRPSKDLPDADAIINPHQNGCDFPCKHLAGVGVAFYLAAGLRQHLDRIDWWRRASIVRPNLKNFLDLVSLGTIADSMMLTGANRILVSAGLEILSQAPRIGIACLLAKASIGSGAVQAEDVAFRLAPRLNAAGRTGRQKLAVDILLATDKETAKFVADTLEEANKERKNNEKEIMHEVEEEVKSQIQAGKKVIVLQGCWSPGLIGIVASRLSVSCTLPVVVFTSQTKNEENLRGSGRSCDGLDFLTIILEIQKSHSLFERFGGHKQAVGLEIKKDHFLLFQDVIEKRLEEMDMDARKERKNMAMEVEMDDLFHPEFLAFYEKMMPFGAGNEEPVFQSRGISVKSARQVGGEHIRITVHTQSGAKLHGIGFRMPELFELFSKEKIVTLAYHLKRNRFLKKGSWEIQILDAFKASL